MKNESMAALKSTWEKLAYGLGGLSHRIGNKKCCPSCASTHSTQVDQKYFHKLLRCETCALQYRWPHESAKEMANFYQRRYRQPGLTTDLPDSNLLSKLISTSFAGTEKDFSRVCNVLSILSIPPTSKILDFGANWGYGVWQLNQAGYETVGFEISKPRAAYSKKLGVEVFTDWSDITARGPFDVVFSSHVLEHTPDPAKALIQKLSIMKEGGWLIAFFPNGSDLFHQTNPHAFHLQWGKVHPFLLDEKFVQHILSNGSTAFGSYCTDDLKKLSEWDMVSDLHCSSDASELMVIHKRS